MKQKKNDEVEINVLEIEQGEFTAHILGTTPLIYNRMTEKAKRELLLPGRKKNLAEKASSLKHNPLQEFADSVNRDSRPDAPTRLVFPSMAFKAAIRSAVTDVKGTSGASKAALGRLTYIVGETVPVYGTPQILLRGVKSAGMNKTPDIRSGAILPQWATTITVRYVTPVLSESTVVKLLAAAGKIIGVGDWRAEKGSGTYGSFEIVNPKDPRYVEVLKQGAKAQDKGLASPISYNQETAELLEWFVEQATDRGLLKRAA